MFVVKGSAWKLVGHLTGSDLFVLPLYYLWRTVHVSIGSECRVKVHEISFQKPTGPAVWCELILGRRRRCWRRGRAGVRSRGSPGHLGRADDAAPRPSPTGLQGGLATVAKEMLLDFGRLLVPNSGDGTPEISGILAECSGSPAKLGAAGWTGQAGPKKQ